MRQRITGATAGSSSETRGYQHGAEAPYDDLTKSLTSWEGTAARKGEARGRAHTRTIESILRETCGAAREVGRRRGAGREGGAGDGAGVSSIVAISLSPSPSLLLAGQAKVRYLSSQSSEIVHIVCNHPHPARREGEREEEQGGGSARACAREHTHTHCAPSGATPQTV
jgi:hypothetical protein